jgi:hypothetical protein
LIAVFNSIFGFVWKRLEIVGLDGHNLGTVPLFDLLNTDKRVNTLLVVFIQNSSDLASNET